MTDIVREIEHDVEAFITPKPGGMIDQIHKREELRRQQHAETSTVTETGREQVKAVRVSVEAANLLPLKTVLLGSTNPVDQVLGNDPKRKGATLLAVDNDVYLTSTKGEALNIAGSATGTGAGIFYLPAGIPVPVPSTAQLYAAVTTIATTSRVSVMIYRDSA